MARRNARLQLIRDLVAFARKEKKYWLVPLVLAMMVIGLVIAASLWTSPFVYTLF